MNHVEKGSSIVMTEERVADETAVVCDGSVEVAAGMY
jgi:hypothetical protein